MKKDFTFDGFEPANTTPVPDVLFDKLLSYLNEAQLKVMLYIIRRTLGFKKTSDAISLRQFRWGITTKAGEKLDEGCGLKNYTSIIKALISMEHMGCIESEKRETAEGDQATTVYRIRFRGTAQNGVPTASNGVGVLRKTDDGTTQDVVRVLRKTEQQETVLQDTDSQETDIQEREGADAPTPAHLKKQVDEKLEEVKTASGKVKAVSSDSQCLQESDEDISLAETAHRIPAISGAVAQPAEHPAMNRAGAGSSPASPLQHSPGTAPLPVAVTPLRDRPGDASVQAHSQVGLVPSRDGAASAANPPVSSPQQGSGPRASGFVVPARSRAPKQSALPEPKPPSEKEIKQQEDRRKSEIWALIEKGLETTFSASQRKTDKNKRGMERLIEDQVSDEKIELALTRLTQWEIDHFTLEGFHEWLPGKTGRRAKSAKAVNGHDPNLVEWQGRLMTVAEADALGFNGGFGAYK